MRRLLSVLAVLAIAAGFWWLTRPTPPAFGTTKRLTIGCLQMDDLVRLGSAKDDTELNSGIALFERMGRCRAFPENTKVALIHAMGNSASVREGTETLVAVALVEGEGWKPPLYWIFDSAFHSD